VTADLEATGGPVVVAQAIASSVRLIRDYQDTGKAPPGVLFTPQVSERGIVWQRRRLDGAPGYFLSIELLHGAIGGGDGTPIRLLPGPDRRLRLRVTALTGDAPLTPLEEGEVLTQDAAADAGLRRTLAFLSYQEKLLAGSWRFNTYFGRDTLMSLRLLAPVLQPHAVEAGLGAVLARLNAAGEVAHEEAIGEYALLQRMQQGGAPSDAPLYDYRMIDDDFMLAVVAAHYLLDTRAGPARAAEFLARRTTSGETHGAALVRNFRFVVATASPFARDPQWRHLVGLKPGEAAGNWRDSERGLGGGHYPYDVNGVFVPAALTAIGRLQASRLLTPYLDPESDRALSEADALAQVWLREAARLFDVAIPGSEARAEAETYARRIGVDPSPAVAALHTDAVRFRAVALDARGRPVPVLNSDEGFALLFLDAAPAEVERAASTLTRPFPAGLLTEVGLLVANPAYAPDELQPLFDRGRYHGTVIWSWQQAVLAAGIERQLDRADLTASAREALREARSRLQAAIAAAQGLRGSELWSWSQVGGRYRAEPFGQRHGDETESNAAQLWSTVWLARAMR
jgi:glycogen debranching enzyme